MLENARLQAIVPSDVGLVNRCQCAGLRAAYLMSASSGLIPSV